MKRSRVSLRSVDLTQYEPAVGVGVITKALDRWGGCVVRVKEANGQENVWNIEGIEGLLTKINGKVIVEKQMWESVLSGEIKLLEIWRRE